MQSETDKDAEIEAQQLQSVLKEVAKKLQKDAVRYSQFKAIFLKKKTIDL
jgi:hypothetical protein